MKIIEEINKQLLENNINVTVHNSVNDEEWNDKFIFQTITQCLTFERIYLGDFYEIEEMGRGIGDNVPLTRPPFDNCFIEARDDINNESDGILIEVKDDNDNLIINTRMVSIDTTKSGKEILTLDHIVLSFKYNQLNNQVDATTIGSYGEMNETREQLDHRAKIAWPMLRIFDIINCSNVELVDNVKYKKKTNGRKGKGLPLYTYKTLHIKPNATKTRNISDSISTHASPRLHLRRGHIRQLQSGETTWVQSCMVGTKDNGIVEKEYVVS